jgi:uncharacterized protein (TIGR02271 family)
MTESVNPNISNQEHNAVPPPGTVIPIMEEIAVVSSKTVETGRVRITKQVTQVEQGVHVVGSHDECEVERITLNRIVETAPSVRYEGETMIIPVLKEVAVVEKKLMLVEEVRVTRKKVQTQETIPVTLRKESLEVIREAPPTDGNTPSSSAQKL